MTDRDLQQIKEVIRQVIREEKVLENHRWYTLRDYCKLDAVWRMERFSRDQVDRWGEGIPDPTDLIKERE